MQDSERGDVIVALLIEMLTLLTVITFVYGGILWWHAMQRAERAAWEGAQEASLADADVAEAEAHALAELGPGLARHASVRFDIDHGPARGERGAVVVASVDGVWRRFWRLELPIKAAAEVELEPRTPGAAP